MAAGSTSKRHQNQTPGVVIYSSSGSDNSLGRDRSPTISSYPKGSPTQWTGEWWTFFVVFSNATVFRFTRIRHLVLGEKQKRFFLVQISWAFSINCFRLKSLKNKINTYSIIRTAFGIFEFSILTETCIVKNKRIFHVYQNILLSKHVYVISISLVLTIVSCQYVRKFVFIFY